jgi:hypothetical protein
MRLLFVLLVLAAFLEAPPPAPEPPALTFLWGTPSLVVWEGPGLLVTDGGYILDSTQDAELRAELMYGDVAATPYPGKVIRIVSWSGEELARLVVPARPLPARLYLPLVGG